MNSVAILVLVLAICVVLTAVAGAKPNSTTEFSSINDTKYAHGLSTGGTQSAYTLAEDSGAPSPQSAQVAGSRTTGVENVGQQSGSLSPVWPSAIIASSNLPHPSAPPAFALVSYSGHYWDGSYYTGSSETATDLQVTIGVPDDFPQSDVYFVILSAWDNAGSYDQVGLANYYGSWGVGYSTSTYCAGTYYTNDFAYALARGQNYVLGMSIGGGVVSFTASNASSGEDVWNTSVTTGGDDFDVASLYACNGEEAYDYTDYEEVYQTTGPVPPYDFYFQGNLAQGSPVTDWATFSSGAPAGIVVHLSGSNVTIANEPYDLKFAPGYNDSTTVEESSVARTYHANISVEQVGTMTSVALSASVNESVSDFGLSYLLPVSWTIGFSPTTDNPSFITELAFSFPNTTAVGDYIVSIVGTEGSGVYNRIGLGVTILPELSVSPHATPGSRGIDLGQPVNFTAVTTGGSGTYSYDWLSLPPGCSGIERAQGQCAPTKSGNFTVQVSVKDSFGYTSMSSTQYFVDSDPSLSLKSATGTPLAELPLTLEASVQGGSGEYRFYWSGLPPGCSGSDFANVSCKPSSAGTFTVFVAVNDTNGWNVTRQLPLTVGPSLIGLPESEALVLLASIVVVIGVVTLVALVVARRRRKDSGDEVGSVAKRVAEYQAVPRGSPVFNATVPLSEVWSNRADDPAPTPPEALGPAEGDTDAGARAPGYWDAPLINPPEPTCWNCKFENPPASRYCAKCGLPLEPSPV
jgi:hypothetical protein